MSRWRLVGAVLANIKPMGLDSVSTEDGTVSIGYLLRLVCSDYAKGILYVRRALHCTDWLLLEQSWNSRCWPAQLFVTELDSTILLSR